jgi:N-glycosylase/DNA lyase
MDFASLGQTLDCGQCFRWLPAPDGAWEGVARGRFLRLTPQNFGAALREKPWNDYFDLGTDYAALRASFSALDPVLAEAVRFAPEIRILRQEPWEALCTFILSQCNNIKRIRGMAERLSSAYGEPAEGTARRSFPAPEVLASAREADLRALGLGFRAPYVLDAARRVASGTLDLSAAARLPLAEARAGLMQIDGVGPKVADCALLYGMHRLDAFPEDVWIRRAMESLFPGRKPEWFGPCAGVAQQYIFHYCRCHPECVREERNVKK